MVVMVIIWLIACFMVMTRCFWVLRGTMDQIGIYINLPVVLNGNESSWENGVGMNSVVGVMDLNDTVGDSDDMLVDGSKILYVDLVRNVKGMDSLHNTVGVGGVIDDIRVVLSNNIENSSKVGFFNPFIPSTDMLTINDTKATSLSSYVSAVSPPINISSSIRVIFTSTLKPDALYSPPLYNITPLILSIHHFQQQLNSSIMFQPNCSHFTLGGVPHMRAPWLYASNVCYNPATSVYSFYSKRPIQFPKSSLSFPILLSLGFQFGWHFKHIQSSPPADSSWVEESVAVSQAFTPRHIYHFAESINQLILLLYYPSQYPPVSMFFPSHL